EMRPEEVLVQLDRFGVVLQGFLQPLAGGTHVAALQVERRVPRLIPDSLLEILLRSGVLPEPGVGPRAMQKRRCEVAVESQRVRKVVDCLSVLAEGCVDDASLQVRLGTFGVSVGRPDELAESLLDLPAGEVDAPPAEVKAGVARLGLEGLVEVGQGLIVGPAGEECYAAVVKDFRGLGANFQSGL